MPLSFMYSMSCAISAGVSGLVSKLFASSVSAMSSACGEISGKSLAMAVFTRSGWSLKSAASSSKTPATILTTSGWAAA